MILYRKITLNPKLYIFELLMRAIYKNTVWYQWYYGLNGMVWYHGIIDFQKFTVDLMHLLSIYSIHSNIVCILY